MLRDVFLYVKLCHASCQQRQRDMHPSHIETAAILASALENGALIQASTAGGWSDYQLDVEFLNRCDIAALWLLHCSDWNHDWLIQGAIRHLHPAALELGIEWRQLVPWGKQVMLGEAVRVIPARDAVSMLSLLRRRAGVSKSYFARVVVDAAGRCRLRVFRYLLRHAAKLRPNTIKSAFDRAAYSSRLPIARLLHRRYAVNVSAAFLKAVHLADARMLRQLYVWGVPVAVLRKGFERMIGFDPSLSRLADNARMVLGWCEQDTWPALPRVRAAT